MKNTIIGLIIGLTVSFGGVAVAKVVTQPDVLQVVETAETDCSKYHCYTVIRKIHDINNDAVCYVVSHSGGASDSIGISCLK